MKDPVPTAPVRIASDAARARHLLTGVIAQYIQDLAHPQAA